MKWEYIGIQKLPNSKGKIDRMTQPEMWRTAVPGGWLLLTVNLGDVKSPSFYPDPEHIWEVEAEDVDSPAKMLLRPAGQPPLLTEE